MAGGRKIRPRPEGFDERAPHTPTRQLARDYRCDHSTAVRWLAEIGIVRPQTKAIVMPDGFAEVAGEWTSARLEAEFNLSAHIVTRLRKQLGLKMGNGRRQRPIPAEFRHASAGTSIGVLAERFHVSTTQIKRWKKQLGLTGAAHNHPVAAMRPPAAHSHAEMAADHLRRIAPVYRCRDNGEPDRFGDRWRFGRIVLTADDLVARAQRKGFDPDAWRRIAR